MKTFLVAAVAIIALSILACSRGNEKKAPEAAKTSEAENVVKQSFHGGKRKPFHGDLKTASAVPSTPVIESLKNNHLELSSTRTIGQALDSYKYAVKKEWRETPPTKTNSTYYVDYICWTHVRPFSVLALIKGVKERGLDIKFAIRDDGETSIAMATRLDVMRDGKVHTSPLLPPDVKKNVAAIYENREMTF